MLRELQLANFKASGEKVRIPIRPLTLIFGANSSGKSSIFQALLLLKQTLEEAQSPETLLLFKGNLVDLGTYGDIVHQHDVDLNFEVGVQFDQKKFQGCGYGKRSVRGRMVASFSPDDASKWTTIVTQRTRNSQ